MGDHDRNAILARRALFISAALAGLGCTTHGSANEPGSEPASGEPPKIVVEPPVEPVVSNTEPGDGARPSWSEIMAKAPPLDVPEGLTANERELLSGLASRKRRHYDELGKIWSALPECSPSAADCEAWAKAIAAIDEATYGLGWLCGYLPEVTDTYLQRERAHEQYLHSISNLLLRDLDAAAESRGNPADLTAWRTLRAPLEQPRAVPCLSCMAPTADPITNAIAFAPGVATLTTSPEVKGWLETIRSTHQRNYNLNPKATLIVRGHASADEHKPESLAKQRAEVVAEALIRLGVDRRHIEIRGYGAMLPISNDPAEAALNCRVDFEVVAP